MITETIKGRVYSTNERNRGVFLEDTDQQLVGYLDTPLFTSGAQFRGWVLRHLDIEDHRWCVFDRECGNKVVSIHQTQAQARRARADKGGDYINRYGLSQINKL